jgi:hypothetical protein
VQVAVNLHQTRRGSIQRVAAGLFLNAAPLCTPLRAIASHTKRPRLAALKRH